MSDGLNSVKQIVAELRDVTGDMYDGFVTLHEDWFRSLADRLQEAIEREADKLEEFRKEAGKLLEEYYYVGGSWLPCGGKSRSKRECDGCTDYPGPVRDDGFVSDCYYKDQTVAFLKRIAEESASGSDMEKE